MCGKVSTMVYTGDVGSVHTSLVHLKPAMDEKLAHSVNKILDEKPWISQRKLVAKMEKLPYNAWRQLVRDDRGQAYLVKAILDPGVPFTIVNNNIEYTFGLKANILAWIVLKVPADVSAYMPPPDCCRSRAADGGGLPREPLQKHIALCYACRIQTTRKCERCSITYFCSNKCCKDSWRDHKRFCSLVSSW